MNNNPITRPPGIEERIEELERKAKRHDNAVRVLIANLKKYVGDSLPGDMFPLGSVKTGPVTCVTYSTNSTNVSSQDLGLRQVMESEGDGLRSAVNLADQVLAMRQALKPFAGLLPSITSESYPFMSNSLGIYFRKEDFQEATQKYNQPMSQFERDAEDRMDLAALVNTLFDEIGVRFTPDPEPATLAWKLTQVLEHEKKKAADRVAQSLLDNQSKLECKEDDSEKKRINSMKKALSRRPDLVQLLMEMLVSKELTPVKHLGGWFYNGITYERLVDAMEVAAHHFKKYKRTPARKSEKKGKV